MFNKKKDELLDDSDLHAEPAVEVEETQTETPEPAFNARSVSYVGPGLKFIGEIVAEEGLVVEGEVEGTITSTGVSCNVGKQGTVKGTIIGSVVELRGTVDGDVYSNEVLRLYASAEVTGTIHCAKLILDEGAAFNGAIDMDWDGNIPANEPIKKPARAKTTKRTRTTKATKSEKIVRVAS
jgi:cytoskeletal protein CcmA (bactofilin family)